MTLPECGTLAGWYRHRRRLEPPCPDCSAANTEKTARWRAANPLRAAAVQRRQVAQRRAMRHLAQRHAEEYAALLAAELAPAAVSREAG